MMLHGVALYFLSLLVWMAAAAWAWIRLGSLYMHIYAEPLRSGAIYGFSHDFQINKLDVPGSLCGTSLRVLTRYHPYARISLAIKCCRFAVRWICIHLCGHYKVTLLTLLLGRVDSRSAKVHTSSPAPMTTLPSDTHLSEQPADSNIPYNMSTDISTYFSSTLQYLGIPQDNNLYYTLLGILGTAGTISLLKRMSSDSSLSALAGPTSTSAIWDKYEVSRPAKGKLWFRLSCEGTVWGGLFGLNNANATHYNTLAQANELWVSDPRAMSEIIMKGHDDFKQPDWFLTVIPSWLRLIFGPAVITVFGDQHKIQRKTPTVTAIAHKLVEMVASDVQVDGENNRVIDMFKWVHLISLEIISQAGMGHSFGVLEGTVPDYLHASRDVFALMSEMWYLQPFIGPLSRMGPAFIRRALVEAIPHRPIQKMKNVVDTMNETVSVDQLGDEKKKEALENGTLDSEVAAGNDIMTALLLMIILNSGLAFAGHDTTSSALSRTLHLLAEHQDVQVKLREEIRQAYNSYGKNLDYDQLNSLSYLDAVCRESLRLHSPASAIARTATSDWDLPLYYPVTAKDGKSVVTNIHVTKGTSIHLSIRAANMDERTWGEDAGEFRPGRWLEPLPPSLSNPFHRVGSPILTQYVYYSGMKFSQLEMKLVLSNLVGSFQFDSSEDNIKWNDDGIVKPYIQHKDGSLSSTECNAYVSRFHERMAVAGLGGDIYPLGSMHQVN
ncbi:cytochrome P450 [Rhizoctonia solani AG-1 IA]|uniref:Cytochrome P450 n=1 Tax=Thanatephorus cucumeris (strain AG1-IA) TaxID=983506 RepID=L8X1G7_THACA|nr:cytochrome P450 [Rhizoctonia solani AG-1 IA]